MSTEGKAGPASSGADYLTTVDPLRSRPSEQMAAVGVVQLGDPILSSGTRQFVLPDEATELESILARLDAVADRIQQLHDFKSGGMGLAAPQIGVARSVAIFRPIDDDPVVLVNPQVISREPVEELEWNVDSEGCLSFFDLRYWVRRPRVVVVRSLGTGGEEIIATFRAGRQARDVLHEIDHLNGVLCYDHIPPGDRGAIARY
jgi:peptide deformylase